MMNVWTIFFASQFLIIKKSDTMIRFAPFNPNIQGLILFSTSYFLSWMDEKKDVALGQFPQASFLKEDKGIKWQTKQNKQTIFLHRS